jgi:hypothetical protein
MLRRGCLTLTQGLLGGVLSQAVQITERREVMELEERQEPRHLPLPQTGANGKGFLENSSTSQPWSR